MSSSACSPWVAFDLGGDSGFKFFYLLFLPIIWASARQGMAGAIMSASLLQVEVIVAVQVLRYSAVTVAELQMLSLAMALIGFFIGSVVDELRRASDELKQTLRLAAAGEMAGALAHELNQPLTALAAYGSACELLLERGEQGERLNAAIRGMLVESARTGEVVRRLRDFFRTGATKLEAVRLPELVEHATRHYRGKASEQGSPSRSATFPMSRCSPTNCNSKWSSATCWPMPSMRWPTPVRRSAWSACAASPARRARLPHRRG
jgi:signal transduction histidine kinase